MFSLFISIDLEERCTHYCVRSACFELHLFHFEGLYYFFNSFTNFLQED